MGLTVALEGEHGEKLAEVEDEKNLLHRLLSEDGGTAGICLPFIDWYGDTVFNRLQMKVFRAEWAGLRNRTESEAESDLLAAVDELAGRCEQEPHLYLRFYGD